MKEVLLVVECLNKNSSSEGIATVNFINSIDTKRFHVTCVYYQFPQFEVENPDWINPEVKLLHIPNDKIDLLASKFSVVKNFCSSVFGFSLLKEYRVFKFKKFLKQTVGHSKFDLIISRTIATSVCSQRAVTSLNCFKDTKILSYFNDPAPYSLMPYPYSNGVTHNPKFDQKEELHVKEIILNSEAIGSPSQLLNQLFLDHFKIQEKPNYVFPHIYMGKSEELVGFTPSVQLDKRKINITHCGSLLNERDPSFVVTAIAEFIQKHPEFEDKISVNFLGPIGRAHTQILDTKRFPFLRLENKRFSHQESLYLMKESDLSLLIESSYEESPFMPVKLAELIGMHCVFLALSPTKSESRRILGKEYELQAEANSKEAIYLLVERFIFGKCDITKLEERLQELSYYVSPAHINTEIEQILR